jgi:hypothetical protein
MHMAWLRRGGGGVMGWGALLAQDKATCAAWLATHLSVCMMLLSLL